MSEQLSSSPHFEEIMIIDDNNADLQFLSDVLSEAGYKVRPASDGEIALRSIKVKCPELLIIDVNLPGINGVEVCRQLRIANKNQSLPVIFISSHDHLDLKVKALNTGGNDYLTKPINPQEFLARIKAHLKVHRLQKELAQQKEDLIREINDRKDAEKTAFRFHSLLDSSLTEIYFIDTNTLKFLDVNQEALKNLGYSLAEMKSMTQQDINPQYSKESFAKLLLPIQTGSKSKIIYSTTFVRKNGTQYPVEIHLKKDINQPTVFAAMVLDISERITALKALEKSYELINRSPVVAFMWQNAPGWPIETVTENVWEMFGYSAAEFISGNIAYTDVVHSDDLAKIGNEVSQHSSNPNTKDFVHEPYRIITQQGETKWVEDRTRICRNSENQVTHYEGILIDITENINAETNRKRLENKLYQSDKMASIGQLAAGVAHEINNPIGYISANLRAMKQYHLELNEFLNIAPPASVKIRQEIDEMINDFGEAIDESLEGAKRVKQIVSDMKDFSRVGSQNVENADINHGMIATLNIAWNQIKHKCKVEKDLGQLPLVECHANKINQVILNLLINAGQAIEGKEGLIKIKTWADKKKVYFSISDNGCGIPPENIPHLFEAFFTTKDVGQGTGLGLSLSHGIMEQHGGRILVKSQVDHGTEFIVSLPIIYSPQDEPEAIRTNKTAAAQPINSG